MFRLRIALRRYTHRPLEYPAHGVPLSTGQLAFIILLGSSVVIGVFTFGFITFGRFLRSEKEKGEKFRELHGKKKDTL